MSLFSVPIVMHFTVQVSLDWRMDWSSGMDYRQWDVHRVTPLCYRFFRSDLRRISFITGKATS